MKESMTCVHLCLIHRGLNVSGIYITLIIRRLCKMLHAKQFMGIRLCDKQGGYTSQISMCDVTKELIITFRDTCVIECSITAVTTKHKGRSSWRTIIIIVASDERHPYQIAVNWNFLNMLIRLTTHTVSISCSLRASVTSQRSVM